MTTEQESTAALAAFMRDEARKVDAGHRAEEELRLQSSGRRHGILTLSLVIAVYVWFFPPAWVQGNPPPPVPTAAQEASALRMTMYVQAQRIEQFRLDNGRIPYNLGEAGQAFDGMEYIRLTDSNYRLHGRSEQAMLSLSSGGQSLHDFLGDGDSVLDWSKIQ